MGSVNLGNLTFLTLVSDVNTPPAVTGYTGVRLTIPSTVTLPPNGEYSSLSASGVTVWGYIRLAANGVDLEWLMQTSPDPLLVLVDGVPPTNSWADQTARQGYLSQAKYLLGAGISGGTLWSGLQNFYNWTVSDLLAKGWKAPP